MLRAHDDVDATGGRVAAASELLRAPAATSPRTAVSHVAADDAHADNDDSGSEARRHHHRRDRPHTPAEHARTSTARRVRHAAAVTQRTATAIVSPHRSSCSSSSSSSSSPRVSSRPRRVVHYATQRDTAVCCSHTASASDWVRLNVGGRLFTTTMSTLCSDADSLLARMCVTLQRQQQQQGHGSDDNDSSSNNSNNDDDEEAAAALLLPRWRRRRHTDPCRSDMTAATATTTRRASMTSTPPSPPPPHGRRQRIVGAAAHADIDDADHDDDDEGGNAVTAAAATATPAATRPYCDDGEQREEVTRATSTLQQQQQQQRQQQQQQQQRVHAPHDKSRRARSDNDHRDDRVAGGEVPTRASRPRTHAVAASVDRDAAACLLLDLDPDYFGVVLNYLRHRTLMLPTPSLSLAGVRAVAAYLHVRGLVRLLTPRAARGRRPRQLLFSWGVGGSGELGTQQFSDRAAPTLVRVTPFAERVVRIALGANYSCALSSAGNVYTFGNGDWGQLGLGSHRSLDTHPDDKSAVASVPRRIPLFERHRVRVVSAGYAFAMALTRDGGVYFWGNNNHGQSGLGKAFYDCDHKRLDTPHRIDALADKRIRAVSCGSFFSLALSERGVLYSWGLIECLGLGHPDDVRRRHAGTDVFALSLSNERRAVLLLPQRVRVPARAPRASPSVRDSNNNNNDDDDDDDDVTFVHVHAGQWHSGAITAAGELYTWGVGYQGRLGHGTKEPAYVPTRVRGALESERVVDVACGSFHTVALTARGAVYCWGDNANGQCGTAAAAAAAEAVTLPHHVVALEFIAGGVVRSVGCGRQHTVVVVAGPQPGCTCVCCALDHRGRVCGAHGQVYTFGEGAHVSHHATVSSSSSNSGSGGHDTSSHAHVAATTSAPVAAAMRPGSSSSTLYGAMTMTDYRQQLPPYMGSDAGVVLPPSTTTTARVGVSTAGHVPAAYFSPVTDAHIAAAATAHGGHAHTTPSHAQPRHHHRQSNNSNNNSQHYHGHGGGGNSLASSSSHALLVASGGGGGGGVYESGLHGYARRHSVAAATTTTAPAAATLAVDGRDVATPLWPLPSPHAPAAAAAAAAALPVHAGSTQFHRVCGLEAYNVTAIASGPYHTFAFAEDVHVDVRHRHDVDACATLYGSSGDSDSDDDDDDDEGSGDDSRGSSNDSRSRDVDDASDAGRETTTAPTTAASSARLPVDAATATARRGGAAWRTHVHSARGAGEVVRTRHSPTMASSFTGRSSVAAAAATHSARAARHVGTNDGNDEGDARTHSSNIDNDNDSSSVVTSGRRSVT